MQMVQVRWLREDFIVGMSDGWDGIWKKGGGYFYLDKLQLSSLIYYSFIFRNVNFYIQVTFKAISCSISDWIQ